jgi:hypothetical protein
MPISTRDIARMKTVAEAEMRDTATIQRSTKTTDGEGGTTAVYAQSGSAFACLLAPLKRQNDEESVADRNAKLVRRVLTYPTATTLTLTDRIVCQGSTWEVAQIHEPRSINVVNRAELVRTA